MKKNIVIITLLLLFSALSSASNYCAIGYSNSSKQWTGLGCTKIQENADGNHSVAWVMIDASSQEDDYRADLEKSCDKSTTIYNSNFVSQNKSLEDYYDDYLVTSKTNKSQVCAGVS